MKTTSERVRQARKHAGLTQRQLADLVGVRQPTLSDLERGESQSSAMLIQIAAACGVNPNWLATGVGEMQGEGGALESSFEASSAMTMMAPEMSWDRINLIGINGFELAEARPGKSHPMPVNAGRRTFVASVQGESMMPEYSRSHLIFVDPDRPLENGNDIVVYVAEKNEAILRRYIEEPGSGKMLKALNPAFGTQYEQLRDEDRVIGVVVADMRLR